MYSTPNGIPAGITDGTGTINPAALSGLLGSSLPSSQFATDSSRGLKRGRSPDHTYGDLGGNDGTGDDGKSRKRGRPTKPRLSGGPESPQQKHNPIPISNQTVLPQTPQSHNATLPAAQMSTVTPTQVSPPKPTPSKAVIKALPTVRDHTTDQLGPEGDEYIPREYDEAGEKKVTATGHLMDGREYRCRTFFVPNRGDKLFMLATECARVLGYRDSYLLFNKNRSLYKIIATQAEKEDLIHQEILPFSYRSRQIAIVTAKSMFRQFGSRVIKDGRRVRDDYWETKARKQGFTEEDLAGEKRPGAAKARDAAAAAEANANASAMLGHHGDIVYSNGPAHFGAHVQSQAVQPGMMGTPGVTQLPMITLAPEQNDMRLRDFSNIARPRQEINGPAYQDRTQSSGAAELLTQAHHTAEYNKQINQQRNARNKYMTDIWRQPHEPIPSTAPPASGADHPPATQPMPSPHIPSGNIQPVMHQGQHVMSSQAYTQPPHQSNPLAQSPMRTAQTPIRPDQMHGRSPSLPLSSASMGQGPSPYGYGPSSQMWPPPQPQQPPQHNYSAYSQPSQPSPHHASPQMRSGSNPSMQSGMQYPGMPSMSQGYPSSRGMYQPDPNQSQYMQQATTASSQPGAQGWAPQQSHPPPGGWGWGSQQ